MKKLLSNDSVFHYGFQRELIFDNPKRVAAKLCKDVFQWFDVESLVSTAYHPRAQWHLEQYLRPLRAVVHRNLNRHPKVWALLTSSLTYACNYNPYTTTARALFEFFRSRSPSTLDFVATFPAIANKQETMLHGKQWLREFLGEGKGFLCKGKQRHKRTIDAISCIQKIIITAANNGYLRVDRKI